MKLFKKWNNKTIEDWGCYMSKEGKSFARAFKNMLTRELSASGVEVTDFHIGHYDLSGFLRKDELYVYFSYSIPRHGERIDFNTGGCRGVLYRTASGPKDYHGGMNNFCSISELPEALRLFFKKNRKATTYRLTDAGREEVQRFIRECEAKRKEILDAGKDTAEETTLPTEEDVVADVNLQGIDPDGDYFNAWAVTDHYDSDTVLGLHLHKDLEVAV
jgi:hypothetical protein